MFRATFIVVRMSKDGSTSPVDPVIQGYVDELVRRLLRPDELDRYELHWERSDEGRWQLVGEVVACEERYRGFISEHNAGYPLEDGLDSFADGFEDFISESRFAWGQQREVRDRPWRSHPPRTH